MPVVIVTALGAAVGARAAAAALAVCGGPPGLLVEIGAKRKPRPTLVADVAARRLEERLVAHLPQAGVAARGGFCAVGLPSGDEGIAELRGVLAIGRGASRVIHAEAADFRPALAAARGEDASVMICAELPADRALAGLAARDLTRRGHRVGVFKGRLAWPAARLALRGSAPPAGGLPARLCQRLLREPEPQRGESVLIHESLAADCG